MFIMRTFGNQVFDITKINHKSNTNKYDLVCDV